MKRLQEKDILSDLEEKMVFVTGPRQVGKTTIAKNIADHFKESEYLNYDSMGDKRIFHEQSWNRKSNLIVFDEIHKHDNWKNILKGVYDVEGLSQRRLVTGSARIDFLKKSGDSLAGRYFQHRLYPFSVAELRDKYPPKESLENLLILGGFPEPLLSGSVRTAKRWRKNYFDRIIKEEVREITALQHINKLLLMFELLRSRVGSPVSYSSLARDIQVSVDTIKNWLTVLEGLYMVFRVTPYHKNISRAILKEPKFYFYDTGLVIGDEGAKFENLVAISLLKHLHYIEDNEGCETKLHYVKNKEKKEIDFLVIEDRKITHLIECKYSDDNLHSPLKYFQNQIKDVENIMQIVCKLKREKTIENIQIADAANWLAELRI